MQKTDTKMTRRERLVRAVKREEGLSWRKVADELGFTSIGGLMSVLGRARRPQDQTLVALRNWLAVHGVEATLEELVGSAR